MVNAALMTYLPFVLLLLLLLCARVCWQRNDCLWWARCDPCCGLRQLWAHLEDDSKAKYEGRLASADTAADPLLPSSNSRSDGPTGSGEFVEEGMEEGGVRPSAYSRELTERLIEDVLPSRPPEQDARSLGHNLVASMRLSQAHAHQNPPDEWHETFWSPHAIPRQGEEEHEHEHPFTFHDPLHHDTMGDQFHAASGEMHAHAMPAPGRTLQAEHGDAHAHSMPAPGAFVELGKGEAPGERTRAARTTQCMESDAEGAPTGTCRAKCSTSAPAGSGLVKAHVGFAVPGEKACRKTTGGCSTGGCSKGKPSAADTPSGRAPPWNSRARDSPSGSRVSAPTLLGRQGGGGECSPESMDSRASKDAKRRLCAFGKRQEALERRRLEALSAVQSELLPSRAATSTLLLHLSPASFSAVKPDHNKSTTLLRTAPAPLLSSIPHRWARPDSLILIGETTSRTKAREYHDFFHNPGTRATPTQAQVAATRQRSDQRGRGSPREPTNGPCCAFSA